jgi:hypothetical protein
VKLCAIILLSVSLIGGCVKSSRDLLTPDRTIIESSQYPPVVDASKVGTYPALTKSGAGYFYDEVLEYRVWVHQHAGGDDFYKAFATYERALEFSKEQLGAEEPLVLVRQLQWVNEPKPGEFEVRSGERITEWQVVWLNDKTKRSNKSVEEFMKAKTENGKVGRATEEKELK